MRPGYSYRLCKKKTVQTTVNTLLASGGGNANLKSSPSYASIMKPSSP